MGQSAQTRQSKPPLITEQFQEVDPVTQANVSVERHTRGVMITERRTYTAIHPGIFDCKPVRQELEDYCDYLRDKLESCGLPSDRAPRWFKIGDGDWTPLTDARPCAPNVAYSRWTKRVEALTEPLSIERAAAEYLSALTDLLRCQGIDKHLTHIVQAMEAHSNFRIFNKFNGLAYDAVRSRAGRKAGPRRKKEVAGAVRVVISSHAEGYWAEHAAMRGDASNTAPAIASRVNEDLKSKGLLPARKSGLSVKTIADHIRANLRA